MLHATLDIGNIHARRIHCIFVFWFTTHVGNDVKEMDAGPVQRQYLLVSAALDREKAGPEQRPFAQYFCGNDKKSTPRFIDVRVK